MAEQQVQRTETRAPARQEEERLPVFVPDVDIRESESEFIILADMPGVDEENVDVDLKRNVLSINGTFHSKAPEGHSLTYGEFRSGRYERTFTLGNEVDRENVKANVSNGVLKLHLPKSKETQPRKIPVSTEQ